MSQTETLGHEESGAGSYAFDHAAGLVDPGQETDDIHEGSASFHNTNLHDQPEGFDEGTGQTRTDTIEEWRAAGTEIKVTADNTVLVNEAKLAEAALLRAQRRLARRASQGQPVDPTQLTDADEWMAANGEKW
ncbi:MAG TPA: hypothetical protein VK694_01670 [Verrucomicrobiae bacterium]|nr:hypothetical protein [Verrucomicrobiae bacterium]